MKPDSRCRISSFLSWSETDGGKTVAVDSQEGKVYHFNDAAADIWRLLDGKNTLSDIVARLSQKYDCPQKKLEKDTSAFLSKLFQDDLITLESAS